VRAPAGGETGAVTFVPAPTDLPVEACIDEVRAALAGEHRAAVLQAPPGAGKTTIVPLRLLDEPWLAGAGHDRIVVLEPRRLATRAAARRMAALLGDEVGGVVGYRTRDERRTSARTRIEVVTEGILTRRLQHDPSLPGVGLVVFDELHERNLQADLGLAFALEARATLRPDLRLLAMSATLDAAKVATLLGPGTPVVTSAGRQHPVDVRWAPLRPKQRLVDGAPAAIRRALREEAGDVLVFLPGAGEITRVQRSLEQDLGADGVDVRPLYGALPIEAQDLALRPGPAGRRRVVLATDIAETSLTVEGVRVVVDGGLARRPRYDARTGLTRLHTGPASKASAEQRTGRAGRTGPGVAYRLWSKLEHAARRPQAPPEILEVDLAGFVLDVALWGTPASELGLLDRPPRRAVDEAEELLRLAAQRLWVSRSPVGVLPLLDRADRLLAELADPGLQPARAALTAEITALKLLDPPDIEGIYLRIGALQEALAMLRPVPQPEPVDSEPAVPGPGAAPEGFWKRLLANAGAAWRRFSAEHLRVRTLDEPPPALLSAAEEARLRQYLRLLLSQAQLALLDRQANIYRAALDQALQLLATQFGADPRSAAVSAELAGLRDREIAPRLPELGAAREHLRDYLLRRTAPRAEREAP